MPEPALTDLSEEERFFFETVRRFALERIGPHVRRMDEEAHFPRELITEFFELGLMGINIPEELGGQGGSFFMAALAIEALSTVDPSASLIVDVHNTLVTNAVFNWGSDAQKRKYLPKLARDTVGAYALSESGAGSDAFAMTTRANDRGDYYEISGRKLWISNAREAGLFVLFANLNPEAGYRGVTAFLIDPSSPGFSVGKKEDKLGIRASSTCEIILDSCRVPKENLLGEEGKGYKIAIETLNEGRIGIGAQSLGIAEAALDHALRYAQERQQFGKPIAEFQGLQFQLAQMAADVEAARLLVYNAARLKDAGRPFLTESAMAKLVASETAVRVAAKSVDVFGGVGFTKEYPVEKLYRDAKIGTIYEGTSNMQLQTIAKQLLSGKSKILPA
ncbi:MAG TPA: acyl-CoA dehydrogenase [Bryobacterales bacterium]|nr:acyl-CoA dehydrogenase [Bryobacterales bacterium]